MLKITVVDTRGVRKLVVEGKLVAPWTAELHETWSRVRGDLNGRKLVIDLNEVTFISREGEQAIVDLIQQGAKFSCRCVLTKHVIRELARRCQRQLQDVLDRARSSF
jgi:anti-anti-sigma regulatory factor